MNNSEIIILEIPHTRKAIAWHAISKQHVIDMAVAEEDFYYYEVDLQSAIDIFDGVENIDPINLERLQQGEIFIHAGYACEQPTFVTKDTAESEYDFAVEAILHDNRGGRVMTRQEAKAYALNDNEEIGARLAVSDLLTSYYGEDWRLDSWE